MANEYNQKFKIPDYPTVVNIDRKTQSGVDANYSELIGNIFTVINIGENQSTDGTNNQITWLGNNNNVPQGLKFILPQPEDLSWDSAYEWATEKVFPIRELLGDDFKSFSEKSNLKKVTALTDVLEKLGDNDIGKAAFLAFGKKIAEAATSWAGNGAAGLSGTVVDQIQRNMRSKGELSLNPNYKIFFNGVQQEQFSLSFKLNSTNKEESKDIVNVINSLKYYSAPDANGAFFLTPPPLVGVKVLANIDKQQISLIERKPLVITNIGVNLSNGSLTIHEDGIPTSIALNIGFREFNMPIRKNIGEQFLLGTAIDPNKRKKS